MPIKSPTHGLTRHVRGGWYKSINGAWRLVAGKREAPTGEDADRLYESRFNELWAGGKPGPSAPAVNASIKDLFNQFIHAKRQAVAAARLEQRTFDEYHDALERFMAVVPPQTAFRDLRPFDFTRVHQAWQVKLGVHRLSKYVANVRTAFNWLKSNGFIGELPAYGDFRQPTRAEFRRDRAKREDTGNAVAFTPDEIAALLDKADVQLGACILLACNGGFGNTDLSGLRRAVLDLDGGWIDYRRGKTGVRRRCPLWPETITAIRLAMPLCKITGNVFSTSDTRPLVQGTHDRLAARFKTLCEAANCYLENRGFYALRHVFSTEAVKHGPTIFVKRITGHTSPDEDRVLDEHYVGGVDARLCEIVDAVRHTLIARSSLARLATPLPAAPKPVPATPARRQGKTRSTPAGTSLPGRTAGPVASRTSASGAASSRTRRSRGKPPKL